MKTKTPQLPNKPSELIRVAIADLKKAEKSRLYKIDMGTWHEPNGKCAVCFAGSVMAFSCKANPKEEYVGTEWGKLNERKFEALNAFRRGCCNWAFNDMRLSITAGEKFKREIIPYEKSPKIFKQQMSQLATDLAKAGY